MIQIYKYGEVPNSEIFARESATDHVADVVAGIIADVRANGDKALFAYTKKFDKADLASFEVTRSEIDEAFAAIGPEFVAILKEAA